MLTTPCLIGSIHLPGAVFIAPSDGMWNKFDPSDWLPEKKEGKIISLDPIRCMKLVSRDIRWRHKFQYKHALRYLTRNYVCCNPFENWNVGKLNFKRFYAHFLLRQENQPKSLSLHFCSVQRNWRMQYVDISSAFSSRKYFWYLKGLK